jgi:regulatory protein
MAGHITALRFQKRTAERINVYLDGQYAFALPATVAASLQKGQYLTDADISHLQDLDAAQRAYERSLKFLAYRPRSLAETRRYLIRSETAEPVIEEVLERLLAAGYLDDVEFARFWVNDRERFRPKGPLALRHELRQKGISQAIIDQVLQSIDSQSSAYRAGRSRAQRLARTDQHVFRQKLGSYLLRRGFGHEEVWPVVNQLWREVHEDETDGDRP